MSSSMTSLSRLRSKRPERPSRSQSLWKALLKSAARGSAARLALAGFFELIEEGVGRFETCLASLHHGARLFHGGARFGVGDLEFEREGLIVDHTLEEDAHGVRHRQTHGGQRLGGLGLDLVINADVEH